MAHQRPAHRQHLLFAAGEGPRQLAAPLPEAREPPQHIGHVLFHLVLIPAEIGPHLQVFGDGHLGKDVAAFGDMGHPHGDDLVGFGGQQLGPLKEIGRAHV